jgi:four helix bundle protein
VKTDIRPRTKQFALRILRLYDALPKSGSAGVIAKQVVRSGTSVGAHYAEAFRAKSRADFINKIEGAAQELEETLFWFDLLVESNIVTQKKMSVLYEEANSLMAIFVSMATRTKNNA